ncbi:FlgD immunoglobulin-like domain containing protein, partial [Prosthecobacter sp.]|uniref:beta strand repeat-containing protein n=1 Tax=Prosthecobacter sp. TaxID=1965333 RepID=UPI00248A4A9B
VFKISIAGAADYNLLDIARAHVEATLTLSFASDSFTVTLANGSFSLPDIQTDPLGTAAGEITIKRESDGTVNVWGGFLLVPNGEFLEPWGITVGGQFFIKLNTSGELKKVTLIISGGPLVLDLAPESFSIFIIGHADFIIAGVKVFRVDGTLAIDINKDHLSIFVSADLLLGPDSDNPIFSYNAVGLIYVQFGANAGFAAKLTLSQGSKAIPGLVIGAKWLLVMNTTGVEITYEIPTPLVTTPPSPPVPTVKGPDFNSADPLATVSYETIIGGKRMLVIPGGKPANGLADYRTWTPVVNSAYLVIIGRGSITLADVFTLTGTMNVVAEIGGGAVSFTMEVKATMAVKLNGNTVFSFLAEGGIQISNAGVAAAISLNFSAGFTLPSSLGFDLTASFQLQINTTSAAVTLAGITIPKGDSGFFARIHAVGHLKFLGGALDLDGTFDITVTGSSLTVALGANLSFFGATFSVSGFAGIYYDSNPGLALSLKFTGNVSPAASFKITGKFQLMINTSRVARTDTATGEVIAANFFRIGVTDVDVNLFGFKLTGGLVIEISSAGFSIPHFDLTLDFFGVINLNVTGYFLVNGDYSFTAAATLTFLDPDVFGFQGQIWVAFSNKSISFTDINGISTNTGAGFAGGLAGKFGAFGIKIKASGIFAIDNGYLKTKVYLSLEITPAFSFRIWTPWKTYTVHVPALVISGNWTKTWGALDLNPPPPPPILASQSGDTLTLNIGIDAGVRGSLYGAQDESYTLTKNSNGGIIVSALGFDSDPFYGVTKIVVRDTGNTNNFISIDDSITATVKINEGKTVTGTNRFFMGGGAATVQGGSGSTTVKYGPGGGAFIAGSGLSKVTDNSGGQVTVYAPGWANYNLSDGSLNYGDGVTLNTVTFEGVKNVVLNGAVNATYETSSLPDPTTGKATPWTGNATFNANGATSLIRSSTSTNLTLTNILLQESGASITLSNLAIAELYGSSANNTFTISGWSGSGLIDGSGGTDTIVAANNANFTLSNTTLGRSGTGGFTLTSIEVAKLTGGASANSFTVSGWTGSATIDGAGGTDSYTVSVTGSGSGNVTINDSGAGAGDTLTVNGTSAANLIAITGSRVSVGVEVVNYSNIESLTVNGLGGNDTFNITAAVIPTTVNGGSGNDIFTVTANTGGLTINGFDGVDTITINTNSATLTVNAGSGNDIVTVNASSAAFIINGDDDDDTITVNSSAAAFAINGGNGNDSINIRAAAMDSTINTGTGTNTVNVGTTNLPTPGDVNSINGRLTITGSGSDTLNVNDAGDSVVGTLILTARLLTGIGMGANAGNKGIDYTGFDALIISLGAGLTTATIRSTNSTTTTTLNTGTGSAAVTVGGSEVGTGVNLNAISGKLIINGQGANDTLTLNDTGDTAANIGLITSTRITGLGMGADDVAKGIQYTGIEDLFVSLGSGADIVTINSSHSTRTTVNLGVGGLNKVYVGSTYSGLASSDIVTGALVPPVTTSRLNQIAGHLTLNGEAASNEIYLDNSGDTLAGSGALTATEFTHTAMTGSGITYSSFSKISLWLGDGNDQFFLDSTPAGSVTTISTGNETSVDNQINDIINIRSIGGFTTVNAGTGNDVIRVNYDRGGLQTYENGLLSATLALNGGAGSDLYEIGLAGYGSTVIRVTDNAVAGPNRMKVYGTPRKDFFLFRPNVIAAVGIDAQGNLTGLAERINYDSSINDIAVYGGDEDDTFVLDDTSSPLTLYGEAGNDKFQIGQIFAAPRHPSDLPAGSELALYDSTDDYKNFRDATGLAASDFFRTTLTTQGYLSNGNGKGNPTTIYGGIGSDTFTVYSNKADLYLYGEEDDDTFTVRAFVKVDPADSKAPFTNINGGQGADFISYTVNAPVNIEGGDGFDTLTVIGTEYGDDFVITEKGILGAGLFVRYGGIEKVVVDALEGNDTFFIQSTSDAVAIEVVGGLGSDTFHVGGGNNGDAITVVANDLLGHSGLILNQTTSADARYQAIFAQGISVNVADNEEAGLVITLVNGPLMVFENPLMAGYQVSQYAIVLTRSPEEAVLVTAVPVLPKRSEVAAGGNGVAVNGKLDGVTLVFDRTNWFIPQYVTVTAPDDSLAEGPRQILIQHSVQQGGSADDGGAYDKINVPTVIAQVVDDDAAGVVVLTGPDKAVVAEQGASAAFYDYYVVLTRAPTANVLVNIIHDTQVVTSATQLTFTAANWNEPQKVRVTASPDSLDEGFHYSRITHEIDATTTSADYFALTLNDVTIGLASKVEGDVAAQFNVTADAAGHVLTITRAGGGLIDARSLSGGNVTIGGTATTALDVKNILFSGTPVQNQTWSITLDSGALGGPKSFVSLVGAQDQSLSAISRALRDAINGSGDYNASLLGDTLIVRSLNGNPLTVSVAGPAGAMTVQNVLVYANLTLTFSGAVPVGGTWSVMLDGQVFSYVAGSNGESRDVGSVDVKIADNNVAGVLVRETLGSTSVIEPSDLILLGGGQITAVLDSVVLLDVTLAPTSPAIVAGVSISTLNLQASDIKATISGTAVWLQVVVSLDDNVAAYPTWELSLTRDSVVSTYTVSSQGLTNKIDLANALKTAITTGGLYNATVDPTTGLLTISDTNAVKLGFTARMTQGRASFGGLAGWRQLNIALSGTPVVGDKISITLSTYGGATSTYTAAVTPTTNTLSLLADKLVADITTTPPAGFPASPYTVQKKTVTRFVGDFGTSVMNETASHDNAFNAQPIDFGSWGTSYNPEIDNSLIPHLTITGTGNGETDFYKFEITQAMLDRATLAGVTGINAVFDIDHGYENYGVYWASQLRLYKLVPDAGGALVPTLVAVSDELNPVLDPGSITQLDGKLSKTLTTAGTYLVEVINWLGPKVEVSHSIGLPKGVSYDLNISLPYHETASFTFAPYPVLENESLQDASQQNSGSTSGSAAQDINSPGLWFTFDNADIGDGSTITSAVPYVTILGSGNGTYDEYRFVITEEMLNRPAGSFTGSFNDNANHDYYSLVAVTLKGAVAVGDQWTVEINGRQFSYTAVQGDTLTQVAAGIQADFESVISSFTGGAVPTYTLVADAGSLTITDPNGFWIKLVQKIASAGTVTNQVSTVSSVSFDIVNLALGGTPHLGETWSVLINGTATPYSLTLSTALTLDELGQALAELDGSVAAGAATYNSTTHTLTITGLGGANVAFAVTGTNPTGTAVISGTAVQNAAANVTPGSPTTVESLAVTQAEIRFGGTVQHNQIWTLTLTDAGGTVTSTSTVGQSNGTVETLAQVIAHFSAAAGYTLAPKAPGSDTLTIVRTSGFANVPFTVNVTVAAAPSGGSQTTTGTASYYSLVNITFTGTPMLGETWSVRVTQADGTTINTYDYVVGDSDGNGSVDSDGDLVGSDGLNLTDIAEGLKRAIGGIATRTGSVLTLTQAAGIKVEMLPVVAAQVVGDITQAAGSVHSIVNATISLTGLTVSTGQAWTLTLNGVGYVFTTASTGTPTIDDVGNALATAVRNDTTPHVPAAFTVTYAAGKLTITSDNADFTASLNNSAPAAVIVRDATAWAVVNLDFSSLAATLIPGQVWSLGLNGQPEKSITVGSTTTLTDIASYFQTQFDSNGASGFTVVQTTVGAGPTQRLNIVRNDGSSFTASFSVVAAAVSGAMSVGTGSVVSHWSSANIQFATPALTSVNLGDTWQLVLTRPDGTVVDSLSYVVTNTVAGSTIDLNDVAKGLANLITGATATGSVLNFTDATGVKATLTVTGTTVATTALISGTYPGQWSQTIRFTGGAGGASTTGDVWALIIGGQTITQTASANGLGQIAQDFYDNRLTSALNGYVVTNPSGGTALTFHSSTGALVPVTLIQQTRNRTTELLGDTPANADNLDNLRPHYSTVILSFDPALTVTEGDVWSIKLNGHEFIYTSKDGETLNKVAEALKDEINAYSDVYAATRSGSTLTITPKNPVTRTSKAWFTGMTAEVSVGGGVVKALFDIDHGTILRGAVVGGYWWAPVLNFYTDSLYLEIFSATTGLPVVGIPKNIGVAAGGLIDSGSSSALDPFLTHNFTVADTYIVRVGTYRHFDDASIPDTYIGVAAGMSYELNVSVQRHDTNTDAIELVGKQITIVDGGGVGQTGTILAYDAKNNTYTVDQEWTGVDNTSKFKIEYHLRDEFSGYTPVGDSYSMVLTRAPATGTTVTIDVLPQITRAYNSNLAFVPEANYGESAGVQVNVATPRVVVELAGSPLKDQIWTLTLNGQDYSYTVQLNDALADVAAGLTTAIHGKTLADAETYLVVRDGTKLTITSSVYQAQINSGVIAGVATSFTTAFSISPDGSVVVSNPNVIGGWNSATIELKGSVQSGTTWTLRLDGINYTYVAQDGNTLADVATALRALLPAVYGSTPDAVNVAKFTVALTDGGRFKVSFTVLNATHLRPQIVFTETTWDTAQNVYVTARDNNIVDGGDAKVVAAVEARVNAIRGPLTINGGFVVGADRSLNNPFLLPGELNKPLRDGRISTVTESNGNVSITDTSAVHVDPALGLVAGFDPRMNGHYYGFTILDGDAAGAFMRVLSVSADLTTVTFVGGWPNGIAPKAGDSYFYAPINPNVLVNEADQVDTLIVDNSDSPAHDVGTLTSTQLTGLGMGPNTVIGNRTLLGGISYSNLEVLDISLGFGNDTLTIASTHEGTTIIRTGAGNDLINVQTVVGHTILDTGAGNDTINVGSTQHLLNEVGGLLTVVGAGDTDVLNVDDSGNPANSTGTLTPTTLTGLGMPGVSEVQTVSIQALSGSFMLSYAGSSGTLLTGALSYDIEASDLQNALNTLLGSTGIRVEKYRQSAKTVTYTITFGGDLAGQNMSQLAWGETLQTTGLAAGADSSANAVVATLREGTTLPQVNTVQTFTIDAISGTFTLQFQLDAETVAAIKRSLSKALPAYSTGITFFGDSTVITAPIRYDVTADELAKYLEPILNPSNADGGLPHTSNVAVLKVGNVFLVTFQGAHRATRVHSVDTSALNAGATIEVATRQNGINYYGIETLTIGLGTGNDVFNVQGTSAVTNLNTGAGADQIFVSSTANAGQLNSTIGFQTGNVIAFSGDDRPVLAFELPEPASSVQIIVRDAAGAVVRTLDLTLASLNLVSAASGSYSTPWDGRNDQEDLLAPGAYSYSVTGIRADNTSFAAVTSMKGTLDAVQGTLNIDAGSGTNLLMVSDVGSRVGDSSVVMTSSQIRGLAPADINYNASGTFAGGITVWSGYGNDTVTVFSTRQDTGPLVGGLAVRTITTLNTGLGNDHVTVALDSTTDGFFVLNTQGPFDHDYLGTSRTDDDVVDASGSSLPLVIFGGQGKDDITGGSGDDIIFGDRGRVEYTDANSNVVQILGWGGLNDITDGLAHLVGSIRTVDLAVGSNDFINAGEGSNIVFGGANGGGALTNPLASSFDGDFILTGTGRDIVLGDNGQLTFNAAGAVIIYETTDTLASTGGNDFINAGNGNNTVLGGMGADTITTGTGSDTILGDNGIVRMDTNGVDFASVATYTKPTLTDLGGNDIITSGDDTKIVLGGDGEDIINLGVGNHIVLGDNGLATYVALGQTGAGNVLRFETT